MTRLASILGVATVATLVLLSGCEQAVKTDYAKNLAGTWMTDAIPGTVDPGPTVRRSRYFRDRDRCNEHRQIIADWRRLNKGTVHAHSDRGWTRRYISGNPAITVATTVVTGDHQRQERLGNHGHDNGKSCPNRPLLFLTT